MSTDLFAVPTLSREAFSNSRLSVVPVKGDHMLPTLRGDWDHVIAAPVDRFLYDSLYVVDMHGTPLIYRCQSKLGGMVSLIKDNEQYGKTPGERATDVPGNWFSEHVLGIVVCDLKVRDAHLLQKAMGGQ